MMRRRRITCKMNSLCTPVNKQAAIMNSTASWTQRPLMLYNRWREPQCVGAIDGSHVSIIAPELNPCDYHRRKRCFSIRLFLMEGLFWDLSVGFPRSIHDAQVLKHSHSHLWEVVSSGQFFSQHTVSICGHDVGHYLFGDPAYWLQTWLMKPFADTGRLTPAFNRGTMLAQAGWERWWRWPREAKR